MNGFTHLDLFSGIGGASYAADLVWPGVKHVFCEIDPFCQQVLKKHWPEAEIYGDIRTFTNTKRERTGMEEPGTNTQGRNDSKQSKREVVRQGNRKIDAERTTASDRPYLLTGGFPCQPFSQAGRRKGTDDNRHLWPEMLRVIREFRPRWVVGENVAGLLTIQRGVVFEQVCADLEAEGYEVQSFVIPACAKNAPHRRDRVWIVAHDTRSTESGGVSSGEREEVSEVGKTNIDDSNPKHTGLEGVKQIKAEGQRGLSNRAGRNKGYDWKRNWPEVAAELCSVDDGLPVELDGFKLSKSQHRAEQLKGYGNAWVPQVAVEIFKGIKEIDPMTHPKKPNKELNG